MGNIHNGSVPGTMNTVKPFWNLKLKPFLIYSLLWHSKKRYLFYCTLP